MHPDAASRPLSGAQAQLRVYTVEAGRLDEWVREWRERIYPLRERCGFRVLGAWTVRENDRFIWILAYDGPDSWEEAERRYYASPERVAVDPDPARHLAATEQWMLQRVV